MNLGAETAAQYWTRVSTNDGHRLAGSAGGTAPLA